MAVSLSDPKVQKVILVIFAVGLVGYLYYEYFFKSKAEEIEKVAAELIKVDFELKTARAIVQASDTVLLRQQLERSKEELDLISGLLPSSENLPALLEQVTRVADRSGVKSALFEPAAPIQHEIYQERPYKVTLRGGFHETALFLSEVASLPQIIKPAGLSMVRKVRRPAEQPRAEEKSLIAEMTLTTYLLIEAPKETAGKNAKKGK